MRSFPVVALLVAVLAWMAAPARADAVGAAVAGARGEALPLRAELEQTAAASAARQATAGDISHASIAHLTSICARAAEVVGTGGSVDAIFGAFRASPLHWSTITDPGWTAIGTGVSTGADGSLYLSVVFCQEASSSPPPPPPDEAPSQPAAPRVKASPGVDPPALPRVRISVLFGPSSLVPPSEWSNSELPVIV